VRVPLIPVLDNPEECGKIADQALGEQCRQLNTYQAAFRHVETIAQVRADKEMCGKVEPGLTKTCLESLQLYVANPGAFENRLPLRMEVDPIEKVLILKPIAGMFVIRSGLGHLDPFRETATYGACYSVDTKWQTDAACVTVSLVVSEEDRRTSSRIGQKTATRRARRGLRSSTARPSQHWTFRRLIHLFGQAVHESSESSSTRPHSCRAWARSAPCSHGFAAGTA